LQNISQIFFNVYTISIVFSVVFLIIVIELVRKNKLQERYSLLWILLAMSLLILSLMPPLVDRLAGCLEIKSPPSLLFLLGLVYLVAYNLHLTTVVSSQAEKVTRLAQEIALLKNKEDKKTTP
jgi:hypothetical protein